MADPDGFREFVDARSPALPRFGWVLTGGDWAGAEDLVQTALVKTWGRWHGIADRRTRPATCAG